MHLWRYQLWRCNLEHWNSISISLGFSACFHVQLSFLGGDLASPTAAMSYQFIFITGQPDAQNIQHMAAAVAPVGEQAATSATPALRAQLLAPQANPAPVACPATAPSLRPKGSKTTSKTSVKPTIHYKPPAGGPTPGGIRPESKGPRPEIPPPGNLTPSPGEASTKLEAVPPRDPFRPHGDVSNVPVRPSAFSHLGLILQARDDLLRLDHLYRTRKPRHHLRHHNPECARNRFWMSISGNDPKGPIRVYVSGMRT